MRNNIFSLFVFACIMILTINIASASNNYEIKFSQVDKKVVAEFLLSLDSEQELLFLLPSDAAGLSANLPYSKEGNNLKIKGKEIKFSYVTSEFVNNIENEYYFVHKIQIPLNSNLSVFLVLDEGLVLKPEEVFPQASRIETDGRKISIIWEMQDKKEGESIPIFVTFENPGQISRFLVYFLYFIGFLVLLYLGKLAYDRFIRKEKKKEEKIEEKEKPKVIVKKVIVKQPAKETKEEKLKKELEEVERHLLDEERKILEELRKADRHEMWQKQLQLNLNLSKAKASRLIRNLEARNLITKIPFGNTNKIVLK